MSLPCRPVPRDSPDACNVVAVKQVNANDPALPGLTQNRGHSAALSLDIIEDKVSTLDRNRFIDFVDGYVVLDTVQDSIEKDRTSISLTVWAVR